MDAGTAVRSTDGQNASAWAALEAALSQAPFLWTPLINSFQRTKFRPSQWRVRPVLQIQLLLNPKRMQWTWSLHYSGLPWHSMESLPPSGQQAGHTSEVSHTWQALQYQCLIPQFSPPAHSGQGPRSPDGARKTWWSLCQPGPWVAMGTRALCKLTEMNCEQETSVVLSEGDFPVNLLAQHYPWLHRHAIARWRAFPGTWVTPQGSKRNPSAPLPIWYLQPNRGISILR